MQNRHSSPAIHGSLETIIKDDRQWSNGRDITPWYVLLFGRLFFVLLAERWGIISTPNVDSPRTVVPARTGMGMPGSFGCGDDDDDDEVDTLILGIRDLGVKDIWKGGGEN
jgi:hypothetical protein